MWLGICLASWKTKGHCPFKGSLVRGGRRGKAYRDAQEGQGAVGARSRSQHCPACWVGGVFIPHVTAERPSLSGASASAGSPWVINFSADASITEWLDHEGDRGFHSYQKVGPDLGEKGVHPFQLTDNEDKHCNKIFFGGDWKFKPPLLRESSGVAWALNQDSEGPSLYSWLCF